MFVGRATELALVRGELRAAGNGAVRRMVIEGPEGIGKTALIRQVLDGAANVRVLAASGDEAERHLRYGVVRQLADQARFVLDGAGQGSGGPLGAGLGRTGLGSGGLGRTGSGGAGARSRGAGPEGAATRSAAARELWSVGEALCEAVGRLQADGPVVVLVDDVQWADRASLRALGYLLRRLRTGRVLVVVICRSTADPWLPEGLRRLLTGEGRLRLVLGGLSAAELAGLAPDPLSERAARRLREHTSGNPLYARELLATLAPTTLADPGARLPAPEGYARSFTRRLRVCGAEARALVAACAVLGEPNPLHLVASVAAVAGEPLAALEEAVGAGLLDELPGRFVAFPDPLAAATVYGSLGAGVRARLHLAAARVVEATGRALRHRAAASGGPDQPLAEELTRYAAKEAQHGLWLDAAAHLELAAGLCESTGRRDELLTAALKHLLLGGDVVRAAELAAVRNTDPRPVRRYILGRLALAAGRLDEAAELLAGAWRDRSPCFAADTAEQLAWLHLVKGDPAAAATWARLAAGQPIKSTTARPYDALALSTATLSAEDRRDQTELGAEGHELKAELDAPLGDGGRAAVGAFGGELAQEGVLAAVGLLREGEAGAAAEVLARVVTARDEAGLPHHRLVGSALLAVAEHGDGRWEDALTGAERALAEAEGLGQRWLLPTLHVACVAPLAALGEHERALAHATAARAVARCQRNVMGETQADLALALLGAGAAPAGADDPFVPDHRPQLIETLVAEGRLEEAETELGALPGDGARARARRARLTGLLLAARNVPARAEESFTSALGFLDGAACPLEEARVLLDLGRLQRRTGRRRAAAARLRAAEAIFARLGARPLVAACAQELEACGLEPPGTVRLGLTPQEYSTARLVSSGLTNRQIARELLISVKTVEYHIGKIYTKLGIGSRVALAAKLAALEESA
ncbi:AAA family ATPase [Nonomuraea sp. NPDC049141]|uniref:helix-turn-helix transcriptional regulator n=1 Tax=Nonomuraea sp. NPDC049141 TaxID=3155500 RepID=UPI0033DA49B3